MEITDDVLSFYERFRSKINSIRNMDALFPQSKDEMEQILSFVLNMIGEPPYDRHIELMLSMYNIVLTDDEKSKAFPLITAFLKYLRLKYRN